MSRALYFDNSAYTFRNIASTAAWRTPNSASILSLTQRASYRRSPMMQTARASCRLLREPKENVTPALRVSELAVDSVPAEGSIRKQTPAKPRESEENVTTRVKAAVETEMAKMRDKIAALAEDKAAREAQIAEISRKVQVLISARTLSAKKLQPPPSPDRKVGEELVRKSKEWERRFAAAEKNSRKYVDERVDEVTVKMQKQDCACQNRVGELQDLFSEKLKETDANVKEAKAKYEGQIIELRSVFDQASRSLAKQAEKDTQCLKVDMEAVQKRVQSLKSENAELLASLEELRTAQDRLWESCAGKIAEEAKRFADSIAEGEDEREKAWDAKLVEVEAEKGKLKESVDEAMRGVGVGEKQLGTELEELKNRVAALEGKPQFREQTVDMINGADSPPTENVFPATERKTISGSSFGGVRDMREKLTYLEQRFAEYRMTMGNEISCYARELQSLRRNLELLMRKADSEAFATPATAAGLSHDFGKMKRGGTGLFGSEVFGGMKKPR